MRYAIANWKMNLPPEGVSEWCSAVAYREGVWIGAAPPFPFLANVSALGVSAGAQNCATEENGAFTGEVSAAMARLAGGSFILIGHSERRALYGESDAIVAVKLQRCIAAGLLPVLCVGESLESRESGETSAVLRRQLQAVASQAIRSEKLLVAYEPVWAIGTGRNASVQMVRETAEEIRRLLVELWGEESASRTSILYGGSVSPENAEELAGAAIEGFLIGGASLSSAKLNAIASVLQDPDGK